LDDNNQHGLYAPAKDGIKMGPYTRQDGTWGYNEICEVFKSEAQDWKIVIGIILSAICVLMWFHKLFFKTLTFRLHMPTRTTCGLDTMM
jgi:hypothetical protein